MSTNLRPRLLVDHSLGTKSVVSYFRDVGYDALTVQEVFGTPDVSDTDWIRYAGKEQICAVTKDGRIRSRHLELQAVRDNNLKLFCLVHRHLKIEDMIRVFEKNRAKMLKQYQKQGPWILLIKQSGVEEVAL